MIFEISYFIYPWALLLILVVPIFYYWYIKKFLHFRLHIPITDSIFIQNYKSRGWERLRILPHITRWSAFICMIIALARPVIVDEVEKIEEEGNDIMLLLDVSASMEEEDVAPNRLGAAQSLIEDFLGTSRNNRFGLILFSEQAFSYFPLTWDATLIKDEISRISTSILPKEGTSLGAAIALSITHFHDNQSEHPIILILSDGANNRGIISPLTSAKLATRAGIKIYFISIGKLSSEHQIISGSEKLALDSLASITGGKTFYLSDLQDEEAVFREIAQEDVHSTYENILRTTKELYPLFIQIALVLLIVTYLCMVLGINNPLEY